MRCDQGLLRGEGAEGGEEKRQELITPLAQVAESEQAPALMLFVDVSKMLHSGTSCPQPCI